jgi:hypothetical protein
MPAGWISAGIGAIGLISNMTSSGDQQQANQQAVAAADPYAQYRPQAAQQLNSFVNNPNSYDAVANSSVGQAYQQAAARTMASQGYTGSGNALVAAANAGGQAYQQQFNNLAMLAGANYSPATASQLGMQAAQTNANNQSNIMSNLGGLAANLGSAFGGASGGGGYMSNLPTSSYMPDYTPTF